jgi:hypothetical protein
MVEAPDTQLLRREHDALAALWADARKRQRDAQARSPQPSRFLVESARAMASHLALPEAQVEACLDDFALWQFHLPAAVAINNGDYARTREALPATFARVHAALQQHEVWPQLVLVAFHMAGFPLLTALLGAALGELRQRPLHALVASNNLAWLRRDRERWEACGTHFIGTQPRDMRELLIGLRNGSIKRLLILVDGPHAPGAAGTRALPGISNTLGFRTALLERLHALGLPLLPITHGWRDERLVITPQALLDPACIDADATIDAIATHIETLLRTQPEQWLNWAAARIRT